MISELNLPDFPPESSFFTDLTGGGDTDGSRSFLSFCLFSSFVHSFLCRLVQAFNLHRCEQKETVKQRVQGVSLTPEVVDCNVNSPSEFDQTNGINAYSPM